MIPRFISPQFLRFVATGTANTVASYAVYVALLYVLPYLVAYTIAYACGIVLSYALMTRFVFRRPARWSTAVRFPLIYVVQYALGSGAIYLLVERAGITPWLAAALAIVLVVPTTFVLARWVFTSRASPQE